MAREGPKALVSIPSTEEIVSPNDGWDARDDGLYHPVTDPSSHSPLWMVTNEPTLNRFVSDLQRLRVEFMKDPGAKRELRFSRAGLEEAQASFAHMIRNGEEALHRLAQLLCDTFLASVQLQSIVIGEVDSTKERFTLSQAISVADLYTTLDIDLGNRQISKLQFFDGQGWSRASLVANVVDRQPTEPNRYGIHRISTRIKAEEEIWNKVVDEIFDLDTLVLRDKKLRHLSRYVKDIFGIKIVVGDVSDVRRVQRTLEELTWGDGLLLAHQLEPSSAVRRLQFVEVKDYLTAGESKRSGWEAIKSVVRWAGKTFEIQILPLHTFLHERELLTNESHVSFKAQREHVRNQVAEQLPLFRFYRDLLHWLFRNPTGLPPQHPGVTITLVDS